MGVFRYFFLVFVFLFLLSCKHSEVSKDATVLPQKLNYSNDDAHSTSAKGNKNVKKDHKTDPKLLWSNNEIAFWVFDQTQIDYQAWSSEWLDNFMEIKHFTGFNNNFQLKVFAYPTIEDKAIRTHNMRLAHTENKELHLVSNAYFNGEQWGEQYRPLIQAALGESKFQVLETGLCMQWCSNINGQSADHWVNLLNNANALPQLTQLYDNEAYQLESYFIAKLAAASWVAYCIERWGKKWFLEHYQNLPPPPAVLEDWNKDWRAWIKSNAALAVSTTHAPITSRLNGFTLAHEGYRIYNGYGSDLAKQSLEYLTELGTTAIAIVPYSFMRSAFTPTHIPIVKRPGMENDEAVLFSHYTAKRLKQFTLLKPQIWIQNGWPGDIDFNNNKDWEQFFYNYRKWIIHYALLAEMNSIDALCIGTEMRHVTLKHPDFWRKLIKDIRKIYHGTLTYAANWGEECEKITFWDELDYIGINCYYPLHSKTTATKEELLQGVQKNLSKIQKIQQRFQRSVWFTEVGFRSATAPWKNPHAEAGVREIDDQAQALCYDVLLGELEKNDWITGLFWWKWPSYLSSNEDHGRGYMPLRKPAQEVLKKYYLK